MNVKPIAQSPITDLRGKVALVTGGSRGVGKGIALGLAETRATVYRVRNSGSIINLLDKLSEQRGALEMKVASTPGRTEPVNEIEMYFEIHGDGKPLVLLHGFSGCGSNWGPFTGDLAREYQLIVPDLRGHGRSTNPSNSFTFRQSALDVFELLDRLEIEDFKAIGVSGGAKTLLHMATQQPSRVEAMVLVSATPYFPPQARAIMREMTSESRSDEEWNMMRQWHKHGDEQIRALWLQGNRFKDSYDDMNFTPPYLSTITARTLIVHGDRDPLYPAGLALEMYAAIERSYLWVIPNAGHGAIFADAKDSFIETALTFLRGDWDG